jgi:hypothetical protein
MGQHETFPGSEPIPAEIHHLNENVVQVALINKWAEKQGDNIGYGHNEAALAWINSGMAAKFGEYTAKHKEEEINTEDEGELNRLLDYLEGETVH